MTFRMDKCSDFSNKHSSDCPKTQSTTGTLQKLLFPMSILLFGPGATFGVRADHLFSVFKLNPGFIAQPYIASINGVARADPCRLLSDKDRRLSNKVKTVEDPVKLKEKAAKVSRSILLDYCL